MVIDEVSALEFTGGNRDLLREMARMFLDSYRERLWNLRSAVVERDPKLLERLAHTLKASVALFAAPSAVAAALRLEQLGQHRTFTGADAAYTALEREVEQLVEALAEIA